MWNYVRLEFFESRFLFPRECFFVQLEFFLMLDLPKAFCSIMVNHESRFEEDVVAFPKLSESKASKTWKANNFMVSRLIA